MAKYTGFRIACGILMVLCLVIGFGFLATFVRYVLMPGKMVTTPSPVPTNYWGFYMMGFAGALALTWGAMLLGAMVRPAVSRGIGTATAFGLILNALFRMVAWFSGEFAEVGNLPRVEAAIMLLLALVFIWTRPPRHDARKGESIEGRPVISKGAA